MEEKQTRKIRSYKWVITKANLGDLQDCVGVEGPRQSSRHPVCQETADEKGWTLKRFRMRCDDDEMRLEGLIMFDPQADSVSLFEPLEDYGYGGLGCVHLDYWENGKWTPL